MKLPQLITYKRKLCKNVNGVLSIKVTARNCLVFMKQSLIPLDDYKRSVTANETISEQTAVIINLSHVKSRINTSTRLDPSCCFSVTRFQNAGTLFLQRSVQQIRTHLRNRNVNINKHLNVYSGCLLKEFYRSKKKKKKDSTMLCFRNCSNMFGVNTTCGSIISSPLPPLLIIHAFGHLAVVFYPPGPVDQLNLAHCWYLELMGEFFLQP